MNIEYLGAACVSCCCRRHFCSWQRPAPQQCCWSVIEHLTVLMQHWGLNCKYLLHRVIQHITMSTSTSYIVVLAQIHEDTSCLLTASVTDSCANEPRVMLLDSRCQQHCAACGVGGIGPGTRRRCPCRRDGSSLPGASRLPVCRSHCHPRRQARGDCSEGSREPSGQTPPNAEDFQQQALPPNGGLQPLGGAA